MTACIFCAIIWSNEGYCLFSSLVYLISSIDKSKYLKYNKGDDNVPIISAFYGILIKMYFNDAEQHHTPHLHAVYGEFSASIDFEGNVLVGALPISKLKLVLAWIEIHKEELIALWNLMQTEATYYKIKGLE